MEAVDALALHSAHVSELTVVRLKRLGLPWSNLTRGLNEANSALDRLQQTAVGSAAIRRFFSDPERSGHGASVAFIVGALAPDLLPGEPLGALIERALLHEAYPEIPDLAELPAELLPCSGLIIDAACGIDRALRGPLRREDGRMPTTLGPELLDLFEREQNSDAAEKLQRLLPGLFRPA